VFSRKPIFGYGFLIGSGILIAFYSFLVWGHHMLTVGLGLLPDGFFGATSLLIAVPTGVKIFSWLATMWGGQVRLTTAMLYAIGMIALFTIGGITGVHFALVPLVGRRTIRTTWSLTCTTCCTSAAGSVPRPASTTGFPRSLVGCWMSGLAS
jgi:hypothetical protein